MAEILVGLGSRSAWRPDDVQEWLAHFFAQEEVEILDLTNLTHIKDAPVEKILEVLQELYPERSMTIALQGEYLHGEQVELLRFATTSDVSPTIPLHEENQEMVLKLIRRKARRWSH